MGRYLFVSIILLIINGHVIAQSEDYEKSDQNLNTILNVEPNSIGGVGFDRRYEGVKGEPLIFEQFELANVFIKKTGVVSDIKVNFNNYTNNMFFIEEKENDTLSINYSKIDSVIVSKNDKIELYKTFDNKMFYDFIPQNSIFKIINQDEEFILVKYVKIRIREADYKGAYSVDRRYDEFVKKSIFYLKINNEQFIEIKSTVRSLKKVFPDKKSKIKSLLKKHKNITNDEELLDLVLSGLVN